MSKLELRDYLRVLRKRWKTVAACLTFCLAVAVGLTLTLPTKYEATAQLFVSTAGASDANALAEGNTFTEARVQSYTSVATSPAVTEFVVNDLKLSLTPTQLAKKISADAPANKVLINLHVTDRSAGDAARLANAVAARFGQVVEDLEQTTTTVTSPVKLTVTQPAVVPASPASPNAVLNIGLGILLGLILGIGGAVLREVLDNTFKSPEDLSQSLGSPVFAVVPWDNAANKEPVSLRSNPRGFRAEAFRQLRTAFQFVDVDNPPRVIAVTSAVPGEGKTLTAINLAAALAEAGNRVCLVEADLRKPAVATRLGVIGEVGLTSVLIGRTDLGGALQAVGPDFSVLTSGPIPPNPSELLLSAQFETVLSTLVSQFDLVIIDTAPLLPVADGVQVAGIADATLLTVRSGRTTTEELARAKQSLQRVDARLVGAVLSMASPRAVGGYRYYGIKYPQDAESQGLQLVIGADGQEIGTPADDMNMDDSANSPVMTRGGHRG